MEITIEMLANQIVKIPTTTRKQICCGCLHSEVAFPDPLHATIFSNQSPTTLPFRETLPATAAASITCEMKWWL